MIDSLQEQEREQLVKFLKESSILRVIDDTIIYGLSLSLEEISCGPGFIVFREGDESDGIYIIKKGSVEVRKEESDPTPIAYLTAGECFGEMSLVHGGPRTATIRVPEEAVLLKLTERASNDLKGKFPALAEELASLAHRRDSGQLPFKAPGLQGNTAFFDLPTVIQAVASSRQSGTLNIFATTNKPGARLVFHAGKVISAHFKHLSGEFAIYELLSSNDPADFVFERRNEKEVEAEPHDGPLASRHLDNLLIEGSRRVDELVKLVDKVGGTEMTFATATMAPKWPSLPQDLQDLSRKIWNLVELDLSAEEMFPMVKVDRFTVLRALAEMLSNGLIRRIAKLLTEDVEEAGVLEETEYRKPTTAEIDLRQLFKRSAKLATTLYALNMVASNLSLLVDANTVKVCLEEALLESELKYPQLASLKVHRGGKTIDVRGASPELSKRPDSGAALTYLTKRFLHRIGAKQGS